MKRFSFNKSYSMRASWMFTYIAVLVLELVGGMLCYGVLSRSLREQLTERNNAVLESIQTMIDNQLRIIDNSTFNIASDKEIKDLIETVDLPLDHNEKFKIHNFVSNLSYMKGWGNVENFTDSLMIYFPHLDLVMKQSTSHDSREFYEAYVSSGRLAFDEWGKLLHSQHDGEYRISDFFDKENELLYIKTLFPVADKTNFINVIFRINQEQMMATSKKLYLQEYGYFVVLGQNDQVMLQLAPEHNEFGAFGSVHELLYKKDTCLFEKVSDVNNWRYLYILPEHIAYKSINDSKAIMLLIIVLCFLMGFGLIVYFINLHYKPIKKMLSFFPDEEDGKNNEYSFLEQQISRALGKRAEFEQKADRQHSLLQAYLINAMLAGQKLPEEKNRIEFEYLDFDPENGSFITFIIYARADEAVKNPQKDQSYKYFVICNVIDELLTNLGFVFHSIEKNDMLVYITEIPDASKENDLLEAVDFTFEVIRSEIGFDFCCAFGSGYSGIEGIAESYSEAKLVMEYCLSEQKTGWITYATVAEQLSKSYFYSLEQEMKLLNLLKTNDQARLQQEIREIFRINIQTKTFSVNAIRYLVLDLFNTVRKALIQDGRAVDKEFPEEIKVIDNISKCDDVGQMETLIQKIFCSCAMKLAGQQSAEDLVENIILYIKKNYGNRNLSITMIASQFSMNHDYISRKFKEATGMRIGDYINNIRVEHSKVLLCDFDNLISDIAERVGFSSYRTYVRVFTNVMGITPKQYRDMQQKN